ncbi:HAD family hydrolase [Parasulfitobacter algicola]|uniref:HAD-IA family hydrolase n=1 Tax=Parasulfitobacter algicola TaxID=2614809 RepID=A0ABX2IZK2_9RHOB|nr:HAD-IA family hydrolase [Sulfitobacter algicola]NSX56113.1 HAD-IA family hydrolase [Sulfitobacter algicola]
MKSSAIMFGAIGTLTETSHLQCRAFNLAFIDAGLDWEWDYDEYFDLLKTPGGQQRIASYAEAKGDDVDAKTVHGMKVQYFEQLASDEGLEPRAGVVGLIDAAKTANIPVGFATSTGQDTVTLILSGLSPAVVKSDFDYIGDRSKVERSKPAPDIYLDALKNLNVKPSQAIAIEDTPESAKAALAAGITCIAFPGRAAKGRAFPEGCEMVTRLTPDLLQHLSKVA